MLRSFQTRSEKFVHSLIFESLIVTDDSTFVETAMVNCRIQSIALSWGIVDGIKQPVLTFALNWWHYHFLIEFSKQTLLASLLKLTLRKVYDESDLVREN